MAEKIQTVLARGVLNTRMRDFYDIRTLFLMYGDQIDTDTLKSAFNATCTNRGTHNLVQNAPEIISNIESDEHLRSLWVSYQRKFPYASDMSYGSVIDSLKVLREKMILE